MSNTDKGAVGLIPALELATLTLFLTQQLSVSQLLSRNKANCSLSVFDKENSTEFLLDLLHYIYTITTVAIHFISHGLYVTRQLTPLSHAMTVTLCVM